VLASITLDPAAALLVTFIQQQDPAAVHLAVWERQFLAQYVAFPGSRVNASPAAQPLMPKQAESAISRRSSSRSNDG
jgi:hypothetical protein